MTARSDHSDLTTCDWTDEFCDCRDLGTIYSLITEEELCARRYWRRQVPKRRWGVPKPVGKNSVLGNPVQNSVRADDRGVHCAVFVLPLPGASTGTGVSSACSLPAAIT